MGHWGKAGQALAGSITARRARAAGPPLPRNLKLEVRFLVAG
jgi:hypothetical protein